jgi:hypothetical protein
MDPIPTKGRTLWYSMYTIIPLRCHGYLQSIGIWNTGPNGTVMWAALWERGGGNRGEGGGGGEPGPHQPKKN